jgi:hypothetical protein
MTTARRNGVRALAAEVQPTSAYTGSYLADALHYRRSREYLRWVIIKILFSGAEAQFLVNFRSAVYWFRLCGGLRVCFVAIMRRNAAESRYDE